VDLLLHRATHQPDGHCYTFLPDGEGQEIHLRNAELERQAKAIGAWLQSQGMQGQRALLVYPPGMEFVTAFFGCLFGGVVAVPVYPPRLNRSLTRIQAIVADAEAKVALTTASVLERIQPLLPQTPGLEHLRWLPTDQAPPGIEDQWEDPDLTGHSLAFLQYTSGSTGTPKGVMLNHWNLLHNTQLIAYSFEHTRGGSCGVFWLPSYHDMGLIGGILQPLFMGRPNVLMSPMSFLQKPVRWLQAITRYRACTSGGPNFAYDLCLRKVTPEERNQLDLSCWTVAFNGAEPVRAETLERFVEYFGPCGFRREAFFPCYGLAEATLMVSGGFKNDPPVVCSVDAKALEQRRAVVLSDDTPGARKLVGCGQNLPDQRIVIADPESLAQCGPGQIGEIWVSGPSVAQGYWNRPEETQRTFQAHLSDTGEGPFLRTGDLGFMQNGELFCTGRIKDLIIIRGLNHYPQDIELTAERSHSALRSGAGAAFTVEHEGRQRLIIVQEVERGERREAHHALDAIRREVTREHDVVVDAVVLIKPGSIPKTSSNKIQRHGCREAFLEGTLSIVAQWPAPQLEGAEGAVAKEVAVARAAEEKPAQRVARPAHSKQATTDIVFEVVHKIGGERAANLSLDSTFAELGLDSLERIELQATLEERFGGRLPEDLGPELESIREVVEAVETYLGAARKARPRVRLEEITPDQYRFEQFPEYVRLRQNLDMLAASGLGNPYFNVHERVTNDTTRIAGRELINFSSYNYLGMSGDPEVARAAQEAIARYGTSVSASRLVSGEKALHRELESALAAFVGAEDAIVYVGGHSTNETTLGHLFGPGDLIVHDALAHNSILQGAALSGARRRAFPHNDWQALDKLLADLRPEYRRVLVAIEGVYSMDGDIAELPRFIEVKRKHKAMLFVDEAHSIGVLGKHGRGIGEHFDIDPAEVDLWMGTLSKSFGSCGGYIAGCKQVVEYLKYTAPGFVYSVGLSPPNAAAALASLRILEQQPARVERLHQRAGLFLRLAQERGLNTGFSRGSSVVPVILGNSVHCLQLSRALFERGINVQPILYPAVEESAARLRFFLTACHKDDQIRLTVDAVAEELARIDPAYAATASAAPRRKGPLGLAAALERVASERSD
jgi:8-amino-7-oxononanoate synthase/acyl carrier protein